MNSTNLKPFAIKEYTKNNKNQTKKQKNKEIEKEKESLNKSQNILLYKILKNKKKNFNGNISMDSSINRTIENTINNEENRKKVLKFLKNKNRQIPKTSLPSPSKKQNSGKSPTFFNGEDKKNDISDSNLTNKNNNISADTTINSRKNISNYKAVTPVGKYKNRTNLNNSTEKRRIYGAIYKKKEKGDLFSNESKKSDYNNNINDANNISYNKINSIKNEKEVMHLNTSLNKKKKDKHEKNNMKYNYLGSTYSALEKQKDKLNISTKNINNENKNFNTNITHHNYNSSISNKHNINNTSFKKITTNDYNNNNLNELKVSNYSTKKEKTKEKRKEFDNLLNKNVELFTIYQSTYSNTNNFSLKLEQKPIFFGFKNITTEKSVDFILKSQSKKKEIEKENKNIIKDQYTGYILTKKNYGIIEKEIKIENNFEKLNYVFKNILSEIANEQYEFIPLNELLKLKNEINKNINIANEFNKIQNELVLKEQKIKEMNEIQNELVLKEEKVKELNAIQNEFILKENKIQNELMLKEQKIQELTKLNEKREEEYFDNQKECIKLKSEIEKIKSENQKLKEKINLMEKENKKIIEDYGKLKEASLYKNKKDEKMNNEIKDLENKIKKYKEELKKTNNNNNLRSTFNIGNASAKSKRMSVSYNFKMESLIKNLENKSNNKTNNISNNNNKNNVSKFVSDDKKIKEDTEDKDDKDSDSKSSRSSISEKTISDKLKDIDNKENKNKNDVITIEKKVEKKDKIEEPLIKNIIINNISNNINNNINNINNNINNKNDSEIKKVDTFPNVEIKPKNTLNEEKQKKMSNALNRFKKKMSKQKEEENEIERKGSAINKSNLIIGMAKILEKQIGTGIEKKEEKNDNKPMKDNEGKKESDIVELIHKKPTYSGRRRKPTLHMRFIQKKQEEE